MLDCDGYEVFKNHINIFVSDSDHLNQDIEKSKCVALSEKLHMKINFTFMDCKDEESFHQKLEETIQSIDILLTTRRKINDYVLSLIPNCRVIGRYGVGFDNIDVDSVERNKRSLVYEPTFCTQEVGRHATALIMYAHRKLWNIENNLDKYLINWNLRTTGLAGVAREATLGIIGLGRIGSLVSKYLKNMGFNVIAYDPYISDAKFIKFGVKRVYSLEDIAEQSDIVTVHVPLNTETEGMLGSSFFNKCKSNTSIINTSRGKVLVEKELIEFIKENPCAFAYLDVFYTEQPSQELLALDNMKVSPHCAFYSDDSFYELKSSVIYDSVVAWMRWDFLKKE